MISQEWPLALFIPFVMIYSWIGTEGFPKMENAVKHQSYLTLWDSILKYIEDPIGENY